MVGTDAFAAIRILTAAGPAFKRTKIGSLSRDSPGASITPAAPPNKTFCAGPANVVGHIDRVLGMLAAGTLDPAPLVTHHMALDDAVEAYAIYERREALKIVLSP